jgi:hypothetical protein
MENQHDDQQEEGEVQVASEAAVHSLPIVEEFGRSGPPAVPPKPQESGLMRPSLNRGAGWLRIVGNYRKGVLQIVVEEFRRLGFQIAPSEVPDDQISVFWSRSFFPKLPGLKAHQKVNWLPGMSEICRKDLLGRNITIFAKRFGDEHFSFWPKSFNLPREWASFIEEFTARPVPYILKPPLAARGEGIRLFAKLGDTTENDEFLYSKIPLAQRYIPNPLLFHGKYKMSFRFYVALTSVDPLRIYIYQDGLVRICSKPYVNADYTNLLVHLTNYDLQVENEANFVQSMSGEETECRLDGLRADWKEVKEMLRRKGHDVDRMWAEIQDLVVKSFLAVEAPLSRSVKQHVKSRGTAYEVTGFDVLLDDNLKPWLLEVNHTPSLCPHTDLENDIKRHMLRDLYQLVDVQKRHLTDIRQRHDSILSQWRPQISPSLAPSSSAPSSDHSSDPSLIDSSEDSTKDRSRAPNTATDDVAFNPEEAPAPSSKTLPLPNPSLPVDPGLLEPLLDDLVSSFSAIPRVLNEAGEQEPRGSGVASAAPTRSSSVSSTTAFHAPQLDFPVDSHGHIQPDRFVVSDLWCIVDSAAEANRRGKWDLCFPNPETSSQYLPFLGPGRSKLIAMWQEHLKDESQTSVLKTVYSNVASE